MRRDVWWLAAILAVLAVAGLFSFRAVWRASATAVCQACRRPVHEGTRTVARFEGRREVFCCPACALTAHHQSHQPVRVIWLTDFTTDRRLRPDQAWVVTGSDVNLCAHRHQVLETDKHVAAAHFDRCSPSILAFARREAADAFVREHGGTALRFPELAASFNR